MAAVEKTIAKQAYLAGEELPERILNAPVLAQGLQIYLNAFYELDTERSNHMGLTPIPFSCIINYARFLKFSEDETEDLVFIIRSIDNEHLRRLEAKS